MEKGASADCDQTRGARAVDATVEAVIAALSNVALAAVNALRPRRLPTPATDSFIAGLHIGP
jgi:hypothetical protein